MDRAVRPSNITAHKNNGTFAHFLRYLNSKRGSPWYFYPNGKTKKPLKVNTLTNQRIRSRAHVVHRTNGIWAVIVLMGLSFGSCNTGDDVPQAPLPDDKGLIIDIPLPGLQINRLEHEGKWVYFIATDAIYRLDTAQDNPHPELIHKDPDSPMDLAVINGILYYTPFWFMTELRAVDLATATKIPSGIDLPFFKPALAKRGNELIYLETESSFGFDTMVHSRDMVTGTPETLWHALPFAELNPMVTYDGALYFFRTYYTGDNKGSWVMRMELENGEKRPEVLFQITGREDLISPGTGLAVNAAGVYFTHLLGEGLYHIDHESQEGKLVLASGAVTPNTTDAIGPLLIMGSQLYMGSNGHLFQVDLKGVEHNNGAIAITNQKDR